MMEFLASKEEGAALHKQWSSYLASEQWTVMPHLCWNRFEPFWMLPEEILDQFRAASLVIFKGLFDMYDLTKQRGCKFSKSARRLTMGT